LRRLRDMDFIEHCPGTPNKLAELP
jgi:hypothetical protein